MATANKMEKCMGDFIKCAEVIDGKIRKKETFHAYEKITDDLYERVEDDTTKLLLLLVSDRREE